MQAASATDHRGQRDGRFREPFKSAILETNHINLKTYHPLLCHAPSPHRPEPGPVGLPVIYEVSENRGALLFMLSL